MPLFGTSLFYTGHRPKDIGKKLYLTSDPDFGVYVEACKQLTLGIMDMTPIARGLYGGALGWDKISFYAGVDLRAVNSQFKLRLAIPFEHQPLSWVSKEISASIEEYSSARELLEDQLRPGDYGYEIVREYYEMIDLADEVVYVDKLSGYKMYNIAEDYYHPAKLHIRNNYLVDQGLVGMALFDTTKTAGGTYDCIKKTVKLDRPVAVVDPQTFRITRIGNWGRLLGHTGGM